MSDHDPFTDDALLRLAASNQDYYRAHGHYVPPLALRLHATRAECEHLQARERELEGLLDNERLYTAEHRGYAQVVKAECERLRARLHNCRDDYHRKVIALQAEIAALKKEKRGCV